MGTTVLMILDKLKSKRPVHYNKHFSLVFIYGDSKVPKKLHVANDDNKMLNTIACIDFKLVLTISSNLFSKKVSIEPNVKTLEQLPILLNCMLKRSMFAYLLWPLMLSLVLHIRS